ncbi:MAG: GNAT family N-acetyltransferase [Saprospiraceae bacterium]|nr:GNAT family N-acetyltransferase [Saprospiraceae bacterium]
MNQYKTINSQNAYREWSSQVPELPVFQRSWWMDTVCGTEGWTSVLVYDTTDEVRAAIALPVGSKWGLKTRIQPLMTPFSGPYLALPPSDLRTEIKTKTLYWEILEQLISALPPVHIEAFHLNPEIGDWLPFHWKGYKQTTKYTFRLQMDDPDKLFEQFKGNVRTQIRKSEQSIKIELSDDIEALYIVQLASYDRKNNTSPIQLEYLQRIYNVCQQNNSIQSWVAKNEAGKVVAGIICVHDSNTAYLLVSGTDISQGSHGAVQLLYWEAIRYYSDKVKFFDFEGSMLPGVAPLFLSFGGKMTPYTRVFKCSNRVLEAGLRVAGKWG